MKKTIKKSPSLHKFTATIFGKEVTGVVKFVEGNWYLFQNQEAGAGPADLKDYPKGYKYSWYIGNELSKIALAESSVTNFVSTQKLESSHKLRYKIFGWNIKIVGNKAVFGCGAVKLTKKEIKEILRILSILENNPNMKYALEKVLHEDWESKRSKASVEKLLKEKF